MTTPTVTPRLVRRAARSAAALPSGSTGSSANLVGTDVGPVHAGRGLHDAQPVFGDQRSALAGKHPNGLVVDKLAAQRRLGLGVFGRGHQPTLALGQHLAGDHQDVAVAQPGRRGRERGAQVVAGAELGKPGDRQDLDR